MVWSLVTVKVPELVIVLPFMLMSLVPDQVPAALVVITVRADFEARCADYPELTSAVQDRYLLTAMTERQLFDRRPLPGWANYRTPIRQLYLCGAGTHPGGAVSGGPGHNAARAILDDWPAPLADDEWHACGDGPVDAIFLAIMKITGVKVVCRDFRVQAVTVGMDAQGEVNVEVEHAGQVYRGRGVSTDSVEASGKAFLNAINRVAIQTAPRLHPQHSVAE